VLSVEVVDSQGDCLPEDVCDWVVDNFDNRVSYSESESEYHTLYLCSCDNNLPSDVFRKASLPDVSVPLQYC
jgi:hypothetical protein